MLKKQKEQVKEQFVILFYQLQGYAKLSNNQRLACIQAYFDIGLLAILSRQPSFLLSPRNTAVLSLYPIFTWQTVAKNKRYQFTLNLGYHNWQYQIPLPLPLYLAKKKLLTPTPLAIITIQTLNHPPLLQKIFVYSLPQSSEPTQQKIEAIYKISKPQPLYHNC